jgi:hypothetical protein
MWHLTKIPQIAHFYWGGEKLSYLRFLSVQSFWQHNPDWEIQVHVPQTLSTAQPAWDSFQQKGVSIAQDYFDQLTDLNVKIIRHDFDEYKFDNQAHEVHKSDFLRWKLLSTVGGLWSDIDILYSRSMTSLAENTSEYQSLDTGLIPLIPPTKHTVGFLLASADNRFYQYLSKIARTQYNPNIYQCMGSDLINTNFKTFESLLERFPKQKFAFLNRHCVYSITSKTIDYFYQAVDPNVRKKMNHRNVIGYHWFAGHPRSQAFENEFTSDNINKYNNLLTNIIKESQV